MNKVRIEAYRGPDHEIMLVAPELEQIMLTLPSGTIHVGNVNLTELNQVYDRMGLEFIGETYDYFLGHDFDRLCMQLWEGRGSGEDHIPNGTAHP